MASSTTKDTAVAAPKDVKEKKGFGKVLSNLSRMKTILKKPGDPPKRKSAKTSPRNTPAEIGAASGPSVAAKRTSQYEGATRIPRAQIHEERARKLGASFGLEIKPSEWHSAQGDVLRIEKPVRVRIHRECHRCQVSFGTGSQCPNCSHTRCTRCVRSPTRRTESERHANRERREELAQRQSETAPIVPHHGLAKPIVVTRPSKTGGQPLVHKPPRMRVRRNCHKCDSLFVTSTRVCETCGHKRCDDCSKSPNKKRKYPYGYPGDEPGELSPAFHSCHECNEKFPPNAEDDVECPGCSHKKCADCPRVPRVKVDPELDPDVLRGISGRIEGLSLVES